MRSIVYFFKSRKLSNLYLSNEPVNCIPCHNFTGFVCDEEQGQRGQSLLRMGTSRNNAAEQTKAAAMIIKLST